MFQAQLWGTVGNKAQLSSLQKPKSKEGQGRAQHVITVQESLGARAGQSVPGMRKQI